MAGIAEIEIDKETCELKLIDYVAVVDCGTVINPNLARIQTEGGLAQGIGMALFEDVTYSSKGSSGREFLYAVQDPKPYGCGNHSCGI